MVNAIRRIEPRRQKDRAASDRAGEPARASARGQARVSVEVLEERLSETSDDRFRQAERALRTRLRLTPELDAKHYVRADSFEECIWLMNQTFVSHGYWVAAPVYSYLEWYERANRNEAYREAPGDRPGPPPRPGRVFSPGRPGRPGTRRADRPGPARPGGTTRSQAATFLSRCGGEPPAP